LFIIEIHKNSCLFQMDGNHDNFMSDIIASRTNTIATFTDEVCSEADMYLNMRTMPPLSRTQELILRTILETMRKVL
jgi:hypothetical protein